MSTTECSSQAAQIGAFFDRSTDLFQRLARSPFINLGLWEKKTRAIATAQRRMVLEFGRFCRLSRGVGVVDVGCGTGAQDLLWMDAFHPTWIRGIDASGHQIKLARERASRSRYAKHLTYDVGDACHLKRDIRKPDRIVGLECAYLFADLPSFFRSSFRALASHGTLCISHFTCVDERAFFAPAVFQGLDAALPGVDLAPYETAIAAVTRDEHRQAVLLDGIMRAAQEAGFSSRGAVDVSPRVAPFHRAFLARTRELLQGDPGPLDARILVLFALSFLIRRHQFENGSLQYLFLEFQK